MTPEDELITLRRRVREALNLSRKTDPVFHGEGNMNEAFRMLEEIASGPTGETSNERYLRQRVAELEESREHYRKRCSELRAEVASLKARTK